MQQRVSLARYEVLMIRVLALVVAFASSPVLASSVSLNLNEVGIAGLEQVLDIARRNAATMKDADMAVSIYNALQSAKAAAAVAEAAAAKDTSDQLVRLQGEIAKMKLEAQKAPPEDSR
jgi:type II secretory pathway component HofQ